MPVNFEALLPSDPIIDRFIPPSEAIIKLITNLLYKNPHFYMNVRYLMEMMQAYNALALPASENYVT